MKRPFEAKKNTPEIKQRNNRNDIQVLNVSKTMFIKNNRINEFIVLKKKTFKYHKKKAASYLLLINIIP